MKILWCYRCKMDMPMLDEAEWRLVESKMFPVTRSRLQDGLAEYNRITGLNETNVNAVFHHQISLYGPPCPRCGKVLRTPVAYKCFECGHQVHLPNWSFLFAVKDFFQIKGRGVALIADRDALNGKARAGSKLDIRSGLGVVFRTKIAALEVFLGAPPSSREIGVLLPPDAPHDRIKAGQEVWVTEPPRELR